MSTVTLLTGRAAPLPGGDTLSGIDKTPVSRPLTLAKLNVLAEGWRKYAVRRLESRRVEDWSARLGGPA